MCNIRNTKRDKTPKAAFSYIKYIYIYPKFMIYHTRLHTHTANVRLYRLFVYYFFSVLKKSRNKKYSLLLEERKKLSCMSPTNTMKRAHTRHDCMIYIRTNKREKSKS